MLKHFLVQHFDVNSVIWQQDGAPSHYHKGVMQYPNYIFMRRWRNYDGYIPWTPKSRNLTSIDFSFRGFMKDNTTHIDAPSDASGQHS
jgi:hypothetical protein